jgi:hypothetical protein
MNAQGEAYREYCIQKYVEFKEIHDGRIPHAKEYRKFARIGDRRLIELFGENAHSNLQIVCGDNPTKLNLVRVPLDRIMRQYGDLAMEAVEAGRLPSSSTWIHRKLKPSISGLEKAPHFIKWSEFPLKFKLWAEGESTGRYEKVLEFIDRTTCPSKLDADTKDREWRRIVDDVRMWSPARRRNSEGEYKIELRKHLEMMGYRLNEEYGESNFDLLVDRRYAVEIKKDPQQSDYDRLFGQLARHLQHQKKVIALIMDAPSEDRIENFRVLVDVYLNRGDKFVEVIKK